MEEASLILSAAFALGLLRASNSLDPEYTDSLSPKEFKLLGRQMHKQISVLERESL